MFDNEPLSSLIIFIICSSRNPFECKDIKIALTEIRKLQDKISDLESDKTNNIRTIQTLMEEKMRLNETIQRHGMYKYSATTNRGPASLQNQYCLINNCYTPTEFALFGVGICILGILIGVVVLSYVRYYAIKLDDCE